MKINCLPALLAISLTLAAASVRADLPPPPVSVKQREAISATGKGIQTTLAVDKIKISMLQGDELGFNSFGWFCGSRQPFTVSDTYLKNFGLYVAGLANQELKRLGYPLAGKGNSNAFDSDIAAAPDFRIGGILSEHKYELCVLGNEAEGWVYMKIDWALFSEKKQKVVFQTTSEGLSFSKTKVTDMQKKAVLSSINNFLASPEVLEALKGSSEPAAAAGTPPATDAGPGAVTTTGGMLTLKAAPSPSGGALKNQSQLRNAVVTLETAGGTGSGFFIDRSGHLLTNAHVVKGVKFARVKMQNGDKIVAEVLKINERTDVALLKTGVGEADALALRGSTLEVGSDVFAIGSPLGVLNNSMTRGVLSADRVIQGRRVLQSDAAVTFGSSGGPLLDGDGRVVGITQAGIDGGKGFNFFIPIEDALKALDLVITP
jgi:S1-C subfamily serine protease